MEKKKSPPKYTAEFRARGVRLYKDHRADYASDNAAYNAIAPKLGCSPDSLRVWCRQAERDHLKHLVKQTLALPQRKSTLSAL